MAKEIMDSESVEAQAKKILELHHADLATARIKYVFVDKASMRGGRPVLGKARKASGVLEHFADADFVIEVALDQWNNLEPNQKEALVDHLLEFCMGEEDENTGEMKWLMREPDVKEFSTILRRHGAWHDSLVGFVEIAHSIPIEDRIREVAEALAQEEAQQGQQVQN